MYMYIYKHIHLLRLGKKLADGILMETKVEGIIIGTNKMKIYINWYI